MVKSSLVGFAALALLACGGTDSGSSAGVEAPSDLIGTWKSVSDPSTEVSIDRICCGERPTVSGTVRHGNSQGRLDSSQSRLTMYPIQKADGKGVYAYEFSLSFSLDSLCGFDGMVEDQSGNSELPNSNLPDSLRLSLAVSVKAAGGCAGDLTQKAVFTKEP